MQARVGQGHVLLVVDDDPAICELVGDVLRAEGFGVHQAPGVEEASLSSASTVTRFA